MLLEKKQKIQHVSKEFMKPVQIWFQFFFFLVFHVDIISELEVGKKCKDLSGYLSDFSNITVF